MPVTPDGLNLGNEKEAARLQRQTGIVRPSWMSSNEYIEFVNLQLGAGKKGGPGSVFDPQPGTEPGSGVGGININIGGEGGPSRGERIRSLRGQLAQSGFGVLGFDVMEHIRETVRRKGDFSSLVDRIMGDKRFEDELPGIVDREGNLVMSPREYKDLRGTYQEAASHQGVNLTKRQFGSLVKGQVSQDEFGVRLAAVGTMKKHRGAFREFNRELKSRGLGTLDRPRDVLDFLSRKKPKAFYQAWDEASIKAAAKEAGLPITAGRAAELARRMEGVADFGQVSDAFSSALESMRFAGQELRSFGLSDNEVQNIALGVGKAENVRLAEQAVKQREADLQNRLVQQRAGLSQSGRPVIGTQEEAGL